MYWNLLGYWLGYRIWKEFVMLHVWLADTKPYSSTTVTMIYTVYCFLSTALFVTLEITQISTARTLMQSVLS